jgi:hypothetical protein
MKPNVYMSEETLALFQRFLDSATVTVGQPDFDEAVRIASLAKRELTAAVELVQIKKNNQDNGHHNLEIEDQTKTDSDDNASSASRPSKRS